MRVVREGPVKITKAAIEAAWRRRSSEQRLVMGDAECRGLPRDLVRFFIAVPSRRGEAASMDWSHINMAEAIWSQPRHMTKNRDAHRIFLPALAMEILTARHLAAGKPTSGLIFPAPRSGKVVDTFGDIKAALNAQLQASDVNPILSNFWLIKGVLPKKGLAIVYGAPGSGKSFFVADLVAHISAPHLGKWRGHKAATGHVAYCFLEGGFAAQNRLAALRSHLGDLGGFYSYPYSMNLSSRPAKSVQHDTQATQADAFNLVASIRGQQENVACVVVDTLSRAMSGGDENSSKDMTAFISAMDYISQELDCLVIVVHHNGKDQSKGARGHSSLLAAVDTEIEITRPSRELPGRKAKMTKLKEGGDGKEFLFELEIYSLGFDEDGDEVTTCLVVPTDADPSEAKAQAVRLGPNEIIVLKAYETFQCDFPDNYTPPGTGFPAKSLKCVDMLAFKSFAVGRMPEAEKRATRQIRDAISTLVEKYVLAVNGGLLWRVR